MRVNLVGILLLVVGVMAYPQFSEAQHACGGEVRQINDLAGNGRSYRFSCCPDGYRVQGVAYSDVGKDHDHADCVTTVCRSISQGNISIGSSDCSNASRMKQFECDKTEVMAGLVRKDLIGEGSSDRDTADGFTPLCQKPGSNALRRVYNHDIEGGREGEEISVLLPQRVCGIASKDREKGKSDRLDGATIITCSGK